MPSKDLNPKKLTVSEIWKLYQILSIGVANPLKGTLRDDVKFLLETAPPHFILQGLKIMYGEELKLKDPIQSILLLTKGLKQNKFFDFVTFIRKM